MKLKPCFIFLVLIVSFFPITVQARLFSVPDPKPLGPLNVRSQNPLYLQFIHQPLEKATTLQKNKTSVSTGFEFANIFEYAPRATGIGVDIDMESWRFPLRISRGITKKLELGLELPLTNQSGGFLDSFIQGYHNAFGFPNGGRENVANGRHSFLITQNGLPLYQAQQTNLRNGEATVWGKLQLFDESKKMPALAIRSAVKLPTGSVSSGTGSGYGDFAFSFLAQKSWKRWHSYSQLGFSALGGHSKLDPILKEGSVVFAQAIEFNLFPKASLVAQINGQTSHFKSTGIEPLGDTLLDLTIGVNGEFEAGAKTWNYEVSFSEDPTGVGPSVDFTLTAVLGLKF